MIDGFESAKKDVEQHFSSSDKILAHSEVTKRQKVELLREWKADVREKMVASDEGMSSTISGRDAELLEKINVALEKMGAEENTSSAVNKAGG